MKRILFLFSGLLSVSLMAYGQTLPKGPEKKASGAAQSEDAGIDTPGKRVAPAAIRVSDPPPSLVPLSAEARKACDAYFEKHKKELSTCRSAK